MNTAIVIELDERAKQAAKYEDHVLWNLLDDAAHEIMELQNMVDTGETFAQRVAEIVATAVLRELRGEA
jgi:hypothetical protein